MYQYRSGLLTYKLQKYVFGDTPGAFLWHKKFGAFLFTTMRD